MREMKVKSKSIECERWYRSYSRKGTRGLHLGNTKTGKDHKSCHSETIDQMATEAKVGRKGTKC
jgi:hypothetical protein